MDPEGVREIFFAESAVGLEYGVRAAVRSLPYLARIHDSLSKGLHLPLTRKLPKRLDAALQLSPGLHTYDAIVLADIDPSILDADDLWNLLAYVEAGGGLLLIAGPNAFNRAQRGWGPLDPALPVEIALQPQKRTKLWNEAYRKEEPAVLPVEQARLPFPFLPAHHPVLRGVNGPFGQTKSAQECVLRPGATALATAGEYPVIAAGEYGRGRVLAVAAYPDGVPDSLFASPGWADLLRQGIMWLFGRDDDLAILRSEADRSPIPHGEGRIFALELDPAASGPVAARALISRADPGWLAAGREPQYGEPTAVPVAFAGNALGYRFAPPSPGLWKVRLEVKGEGWANAREVEVEAESATGLKLSIRDGRYIVAPGWTLPLGITAKVPVTVELTPSWDRRRPAPALEGKLTVEEAGAGRLRSQEVDLPIPELEPGDYEVVATANGEEARLRFAVTDEVRRPGLTFVAGGGHGGSEEIQRRSHAYYRERGFNAVAGLGNYREYLAQRDGMVVWGEYVGASLLATHTYYGEEGTKTTDPCIFDPAHETKLRAFLENRFQTFARSPRATYLEVLDEPHMPRANVCHCARCREEYKAKYGYDLPTWGEAIAAGDRRTKEYFEWVVDYAARAFRMGYDIWKSFGPGPGLTHVLCAIGSGSMTARCAIAEDLPWTSTADLIEFDCYNYMYPNWRGCKELMWNEFHYLFGHFRFLSLRDNKPLGFFIQVTDRDAPVMPWDPVRAPAETLYAALGGGAKFFHLMSQAGFTNTQNCREEKFAALGEEIVKVRKAAPLLERAQTPRSRIAAVFNFHDRLYRSPEPWLPEGYVGLGFYTGEHRPYDNTWPNHKGNINVAEMLFRGFGQTDVIDQRALHEGVLDDYRGFVLNGVDYITDEDARAVVKFVEEGGLLICDHIPTHNTNGESSNILAPLFTGEPRHFDKEVTVTYGNYGKGRTLLFSADLNELYTAAVEQKEDYLRYLVKHACRDFFDSGGIRPHVRSNNYDVETNVLLAPESVVLVSVNHTAERRQAVATLFAPPVEINAAADLITGRPYPITETAEGIEVELNLGDREGSIIGLFPTLPAELAITPAANRFTCGNRLAFTVTLTDAAGGPALGDHIIELTVTDPTGEERPRYTGRFCTAGGELRIDKPLAINVHPGEWTITAYEPISRKVAKATVIVE
jgi:uncharacterized membrane protein